MAESRETDLVTIAAIRKGKDKTPQYLLNERQRIFVLADKAAAQGDGGRLLTEALEKRTPVKVTLDTRRPVIQRVVAPAPRELEAFAKTRIPLPKAQTEPNATIDVAKIDPTRFNIVDAYLKWRCFRLCTRVIPSYAKAKEIFDFCAQLSCHLPGPTRSRPASRSSTSVMAAMRARTRCAGSSPRATATAARRSSATPPTATMSWPCRPTNGAAAASSGGTTSRPWSASG